MSDGYRQEVFNVLLAQLLQERGVIAAPENILKAGPEHRRRMPDVIVSYQGLRTVIEGEVDAPNAREKAMASASKRVEEGIAHIGIAVVYPETLRQADFTLLKSDLEQSELAIAVITEAGESDFAKGNVDYLESALRSAFQRLVQEDIVAVAVAEIDAAVDRFAGEIVDKAGIVGRAADTLGIRELPKRSSGQEDSEKSTPISQLSYEEKGAISRIAGLILINAMIFQDILAGQVPTILSIDGTLNLKNAPLWDFRDIWKKIVEEIDYYAIFSVARKLLSNMGSDPDANNGVKVLAQAAQKIVLSRAALHRDLMGRVYHRLLADAKYLGTYYTTIPAAALLLKLALKRDDWPIHWHELEQVQQLRVADLSSGTGTLLMAAADALMDNYISTMASHGLSVDLTGLQKRLSEDILYGYDVLPSAVHLTASTLALRAPHISFEKMNLFSLPLGGEFLSLGSIDFLNGRNIQMPLDMFGALPETRKVSAQTVEAVNIAPIPDLDLCVMNPPFTRSVGGNLLFGSSPDAERKAMQRKLSQMLRQPHIMADSTAGLGAVFVAVGDRYIKPGGRIALVLPKALLSGVAWAKTRELINRKYRLEYVIASQDPERWNFSESTDLSEVLVIATKREATDNGKPNGNVIGINLWSNPNTAFEALSVAHTLTRETPPSVTDSQGALSIVLGKRKIGEALALPRQKTQASWLLPCAFAQSDLIRVAYHLDEGKLWLPGYGQVGQVPLCSLDQLGLLGPDRRDIHDGFELSQAKTAYASFWGHDASEMLTLAQQPNQYLSPLAQAKKGRSLRRVELLWPLAGKIVIAERLRLNTQRIIAARIPQPVLSNVWWSFSLKNEFAQGDIDKSLVLWLNSTLALFLALKNRAETQGAWVDFKKPTLAAMPVLDVRTLSPEQLTLLATTYDRLCELPLLPFPQMAEDEVRAEIDRSIVQALGLPDISVLRTLLGQEPVVSMKPLA